MKIVFFGTPEYAKPICEYLLKNETVVAAVTKQDTPANRHLNIQICPVKELSCRNNLLVFTPAKLKDENFVFELLSLKPDLAIVVAYGKILPKILLDVFPMGCVNIHYSILPKYRGAAPIQWAIINNENETGVTSFFMDEGLDTGKIIFQKKIQVCKDDDTIKLREKLIPVAIDVLKETLALIKNGEKGTIQAGIPSFAPPLKKENGKIDWKKSAEDICNLVRGTKPWPGAYLEIIDKDLKIKRLKIIETEVFLLSCNQQDDYVPGSVISIQKNIGFVVKCGTGYLLVKSIQPASKNIMSAWSFLQGQNLKIGDKLS
ncbi:MAG: methionyl-tRNA formyltransferase [Elusimicrobia bacterium]|nr:methionyl-tRNA formyltransferase [Elusimicrobiota bacterium]